MEIRLAGKKKHASKQSDESTEGGDNQDTNGTSVSGTLKKKRIGKAKGNKSNKPVHS